MSWILRRMLGCWALCQWTLKCRHVHDAQLPSHQVMIVTRAWPWNLDSLDRVKICEDNSLTSHIVLIVFWFWNTLICHMLIVSPLCMCNIVCATSSKPEHLPWYATLSGQHTSLLLTSAQTSWATRATIRSFVRGQMQHMQDMQHTQLSYVALLRWFYMFQCYGHCMALLCRRLCSGRTQQRGQRECGSAAFLP